jgi:hypothetical protein
MSRLVVSKKLPKMVRKVPCAYQLVDGGRREDIASKLFA